MYAALPKTAEDKSQWRELVLASMVESSFVTTTRPDLILFLLISYLTVISMHTARLSDLK